MVDQPPELLRVLLLDETGRYSDPIARVLGPDEGIDLAVASIAGGDAESEARRHQPDVVLLIPSRSSDPGMIIQELENVIPTAPVLVLLTDNDIAVAQAWTMAGARGYLTQPFGRQELLSAIRHVHQRELRRRARLSQLIQGGVAAPTANRLLAIHGAKGGVGTTTLAVNLAIALRRLTHRSVALIDANVTSGDVGVSLNLRSENSIVDLLPHLRDLDSELLQRVMLRHASGVRVLLAPQELDTASVLTGEQVSRILAKMVLTFDFTVVDTSSTLDPITAAVLDTADVVVVVTTPELAALKNTAAFLRLCFQHGYGGEKLQLVINRADSQGAMETAQVQASLRMKAAGRIRSSGGAMVAAANSGEPVLLSHPRSPAAKDIMDLARKLAAGKEPLELVGAGHEDEAAPDQPGARAGVLSFMPVLNRLRPSRRAVPGG